MLWCIRFTRSWCVRFIPRCIRFMLLWCIRFIGVTRGVCQCARERVGVWCTRVNASSGQVGPGTCEAGFGPGRAVHTSFRSYVHGILRRSELLRFRGTDGIFLVCSFWAPCTFRALSWDRRYVPCSGRVHSEVTDGTVAAATGPAAADGPVASATGADELASDWVDHEASVCLLPHPLPP